MGATEAEVGVSVSPNAFLSGFPTGLLETLKQKLYLHTEMEHYVLSNKLNLFRKERQASAFYNKITEYISSLQRDVFPSICNMHASGGLKVKECFLQQIFIEGPPCAVGQEFPIMPSLGSRT